MGEDSIVRSQARFLRQRLEEYFATEGRDEPIRLTIPKGSYVPEFHFREGVAIEPEPAKADKVAPVAIVSPVEIVGKKGAEPSGWPGRQTVFALVAVAIVCAVGFLVWHFVRGWRAGLTRVSNCASGAWFSIRSGSRLLCRRTAA